MPMPIRMPKFGMTMTEGTVVQWLAVEGELVETGQSIAEIETEKIVNELEAPAAGTLTRISVEEGASTNVSEIIAWILLEGETADDIVSPNAVLDQVDLSTTSQALIGPMTTAHPPVQRTTRGSVSPAARRVAQELGVDLATVTGTGPDGRITKGDILNAHQSHTACDTQDAAYVVEPLSTMRRAIVRHVTRSAEIPQIVLYFHAKASALVKVHQQDRTIAYDDLVLWCVSRTLVDHRHLNASFADDGIRLYKNIDVGLAVAAEGGLVIAMVRDALRLSLRKICDERKRLVEGVHSRQIKEHDIGGGAFTLTNLGMYPVDRFEPLLNPPGTAILSIGQIQQVAGPTETGQIELRPVIEFGLALDHRVVDGAAGAAFAKDFIACIETVTLEDA
jgi:pyruvate dehydrogenase E2 component (dihydrolipoamide acetyltransferase)